MNKRRDIRLIVVGMLAVVCGFVVWWSDEPASTPDELVFREYAEEFLVTAKEAVKAWPHDPQTVLRTSSRLGDCIQGSPRMKERSFLRSVQLQMSDIALKILDARFYFMDRDFSENMINSENESIRQWGQEMRSKASKSDVDKHISTARILIDDMESRLRSKYHSIPSRADIR